MEWLRKFMQGRYGADQLSFTLLILSLVISLITSLFSIPLIALIGYIPLIFSLYRMLSKNISKRRKENQVFLKKYQPIESWCKKKVRRIKALKTHKYFKCPNCSQELRVPRGKGKITITCPKCHSNFSKKS